MVKVTCWKCGIPRREDGVLDVWPVMARALALRYMVHLLRIVEKPHHVLAIVSSRCRKGIKQLAFLPDRRCLALLTHHQGVTAFGALLRGKNATRRTKSEREERFIEQTRSRLVHPLPQNDQISIFP